MSMRAKKITRIEERKKKIADENVVTEDHRKIILMIKQHGYGRLHGEVSSNQESK